ncbi:hypothetical protein [Priestia megaterium]|uniref:hypothetical protein n=1 Tax=Priestia megaterium TaxID=1404 RepID=UPI00244885AD|nr:hypothetical protein [Priestia megaterium]MDH2363781.1 hypothetical protein [Priestia megaterium]
METPFVFFVATTMIIYGIAIVQLLFRGKVSLFKGWLALATISIAMLLQTGIYQDGFKFESSLNPYSTPGYEVMSNIVIIFVFLIITMLLYIISYFASRIAFKFLLHGSYIGKSKIIDYFIAPIVFLFVNYYVYLEYITK